MDNLQPREINVFFLDGTEEYLNKKELVLCYGGFYSKLYLKDLIKVAKNKKISLGLQEWMPIKWNFSDDLKMFYKNYWQYFGDRPNNFEKWWNDFKKKSLEIRAEFLREVREYISIIISAWCQQIPIPYYKKKIKTMKDSSNDMIASKRALKYLLKKSIKTKRKIHKWLHERLFSRIGLNMAPAFIHLLMCDYEHYRSETRSLLLNEYFNAYHKAEGFYSGPLKYRGAFPDLAFGSTYFNDGLQIADIVVGCVNSLIRAWRLNKKPKKEAKEIFLSFKDAFVKKPQTKIIFNYGLKVEPESFESYLIENKLL